MEDWKGIWEKVSEVNSMRIYMYQIQILPFKFTAAVRLLFTMNILIPATNFQTEGLLPLTIIRNCLITHFQISLYEEEP
jgi:hypothetical protein